MFNFFKREYSTNLFFYHFTLPSDQVTDIVDAMILKRLLEGLLHYGVVTIMTSKLGD
jgi:hypothetical protein